MDVTLQDPLVGQLLDGRYRVESLVARGGMGTVYAAVDVRLDRRVAVKVMHPALAADEAFVARFIREAKAVARLPHPNVVAVYDQGSDAATGRPTVFLVMEYVEGRTLRDLLRSHGPFSPREAFDVVEPVLAALGAAHQAGLVHRDVKPENVLLAVDGGTKVVDFGLARAVSTASNPTQGVLIGTVAYLAPEQVARGLADPRADVYAAGILLYELLTGAPPYDGEAPLQVAYRHVHEDVPPPSLLVPGLAPGIDALVRRAASRDPADRPADGNALLAEVVAVRRGLRPEQLDARPPAAGGAPTVIVPRPAASPAATRDTRAFEAETLSAAGLAVPVATPGLPVPAPAAATVTGRVTTSSPPGGSRPGARTGTARRGGGWRRWPIGVLAVLVIAALLSAGAWWLAAGPGLHTDAPALLRLSRAQAEARARQLGLSVDYQEPRFDEQVARDHVLSTDPSPGERIRRNGTIRVVLSRGKERYAVPDLRALTVEAATAKLAESTLTIGEVTRRYSDDVEAGRVVSSNPALGTQVRRGQVVALVVSRGVQPVTVPRVLGRPSPDAIAALRRVRLPASVREQYDERVPKGIVLSQEPASGTVPRGTTVTLVVSQGPPPVPVPNVIDQRTGDAVRTLRAAGFAVRVQGTRVLNRVIACSPAPGTAAPRGSTVVLTTV